MTTSEDIKILKRKLTGFVGFANLPKQWHRRSVRKGFSLNFMVVGESGLGKSTLVNTLFNQEFLAHEDSEEVQIQSKEHVLEEDGVKLKLSIITAPGFGELINNEAAWEPIVAEIDSRFNQYLEAESRVNRGSIEDGRVHALLYFIEPTGHSLKALDVAFLQAVHEKVNVIPIILKLDTFSGDELLAFKQRINADLAQHQIRVFRPEIGDAEEENSRIVASLPFAVVGLTNEVKTPDGRLVRGRAYPWGVIEVDNEEHNDFLKLRLLLVRNNLEELKEVTNTVLYEQYRTSKLKSMGIEQDDSVFREFDPLTRQEEERALHEAKLAKMEAEMKQVFQLKVSEKEKKLQRLEADLFARHKEMKEKLTKQIELLEAKKAQLEKQKSQPDSLPAPSVPHKTRKGFLRS